MHSPKYPFCTGTGTQEPEDIWGPEPESWESGPTLQLEAAAPASAALFGGPGLVRDAPPAYDGGLGEVGGDYGGAGGGEDEDTSTESEPDRGSMDERLTSMVEHCIAWGGEQRLRVQVTLSTAGASLGGRDPEQLWCF